MCLLGLAFQQSSEFPVLILANREELYARPSAGPRLFPRQENAAAWLGGSDLAAGGTWLGVNEHGVVVAVTNRRKSTIPSRPTSRGLLCRRLLETGETASDCIAKGMRELARGDYAGCNLLTADCHCAAVIEAADEIAATQLQRGLHLITNGPLNDACDVRIERARRELLQSEPTTTDAWLREGRRICALPAQNGQPAICLVGADGGTVSSTVLGIGRDLGKSHYWHAPGPPDRTSYEDYTAELRRLFLLSGVRPLPDIAPPDDSPARRAVRHLAPGEFDMAETPAGAPHRIHLRGPWQCEPLARAERGADGALKWSAGALPPAGTVRLPAAWHTLFGDFRGQVRFRRKFHPPSNIGRGTRLWIVLDAFGGAGTVRLNGQLLGPIAARLEVTGRLEVNNELEIELEVTDQSGGWSGGLSGPVVLEIRDENA